jgi:glutamate racemase
MKTNNRRPIGVFDSGVGGLTVARSMRQHLPEEDIIYFGDTARVPYGNKSRPTIIRFSGEIMTFLMKHKVKMVVVACNTASSFSLPFLSRNYPLPVIGVIRPGVREAVRLTENGRIGVIGTSATISSGSYAKELARVSRDCRLFPQSCPLFVPLVENGLVDDPVTYEMAGRYLNDLKANGVDTLILGCTHYPLLKEVIGDVVGHGVNLVDSSYVVAKEVLAVLEKNGLKAPERKKAGTMECFVSDDREGFRKLARMIMGEDVDVEKVALS